MENKRVVKTFETYFNINEETAEKMAPLENEDKVREFLKKIKVEDIDAAVGEIQKYIANQSHTSESKLYEFDSAFGGEMGTLMTTIGTYLVAGIVLPAAVAIGTKLNQAIKKRKAARA